MNINDINNQLDAIKQQYDDAVKAIREEGGLKDIFKDFFDKNPHFKALHWYQYVPYFMDGDPCEFSINDIYVALGDAEIDPDKWESRWTEEEEGWEYATSYTRDRNPNWGANPGAVNENYSPDLAAICKFIYSNSDLIETLFGSHAKILVTPEKISVEEYVDHD